MDSLLNELAALEHKNQPSDLRNKAVLCQEIADWYNKAYSDQDDSRSYLLQAIAFREGYMEVADDPTEEDYLDLVELYRKMALFEAFRGDIAASNTYIIRCENWLRGLEGLIPSSSYNAALLDFYHSSFALSLNFGNVEQAQVYWNRAYEITTAHSAFAYLRMNLLSELSVFYSSQGRHEEAIDFARQGLVLYESQDTIDQPHDRFIHFVLRAYFNAGKYDTTIAFIQGYEQYASFSSMEAYLDANPDMVTRSFFENLFILGETERYRYEKSNDKENLIEAYNWTRNGFLLAENVALQNDGEKIGNAILRPEEKLRKLMTMFDLFNREIGADRADVLEFIRIIDTYQSGRLHLERISQEVNSNYWSREKELKNRVRFLNRQIEEDSGNETLRDEYRTLSYELAELKKKTKRDKLLEEYRLSKSNFSAQLEDHLKRDSLTLLTYFPDRPNKSIYVVGIGPKNAFFEKVEVTENLTFLIERSYLLNGQIQHNSDSLVVQEKLNRQLYDYLIGPIASNLDSKNLLISPMNELSYVSFDALMDENGTYLVENYTIHYSYSVYGIIGTKAQPSTTKKMYCFYPSDYGFDFLSPLVNAKEEVNHLEAEFGAEVYRSTEATKANFLDNAGSGEIIHLASHSIMDVDQPYQSYLIFNSNQGDSLNRLFAHEIFALDIQSDLVTLSSCNTAKGKIEDGTGIISLANAFYYSGIPATVGSLWSAQDKSSSEIMISFYENLQAGYSKSESLRLAKLNYIEKADKIKRQPFFWANYVVYGDDTPLYEKTTSTPVKNYLIGIGLSVLLIVLGWIYFRSSSKRSASSK